MWKHSQSMPAHSPWKLCEHTPLSCQRERPVDCYGIVNEGLPQHAVPHKWQIHSPFHAGGGSSTLDRCYLPNSKDHRLRIQQWKPLLGNWKNFKTWVPSKIQRLPGWRAGKLQHLKMYSPLKMDIFQCHVDFQGCNMFLFNVQSLFSTQLTTKSTDSQTDIWPYFLIIQLLNQGLGPITKHPPPLWFFQPTDSIDSEGFPGLRFVSPPKPFERMRTSTNLRGPMPWPRHIRCHIRWRSGGNWDFFLWSFFFFMRSFIFISRMPAEGWGTGKQYELEIYCNTHVGENDAGNSWCAS